VSGEAMKKLLSVFFLITLASPLFGQQAVFRPGGLSFITPLQISVAQDNNFLIDRTDPNQRLFVLSLPPSVLLGRETGPVTASDQVLTLTMPTLVYEKGSRRYELVGGYMPEFEVFRHNTDLNAWNHAAMADFTYFPTRTTRFVIADEYRGAQDAARTLRNPFLLLPRGAFRQNNLIAGFQVEASPRTLFSVDYDSAITTYGQTDPLQTRILDTISHGFTFSARRLLTRKQRFSASYSVFKLLPINHQKANDEAVDTKREFERPITAFKGQYRYNFSASSVLELSGGVAYMDNSTSYLARVGGYRRFGAFWIGGGYGRELAILARPLGLPTGLTNTTYYDLASFRLIGQPSRNVAVQMEIAGAVTASKQFPNGGRSFLSRTRLDYRLTDRTVAFTTLETYHQPFNEFVRAPLSRNRFSVGLEFSLASDAARRLDPRNTDEQYVALTDHKRRRRLPE
jgi:hypothetical protein